MKQKPRWTLEMFTMGFALLAAALSLLLLVVQPALGPVVLVVAVVCIILVVVSRYRIRRWAARWVTGTSFENSRTQYSLASLSQPAALLSGDTVVWYNLPFRDRVLAGGDQLAGRVNKMLPGLDMAQCAGPDGQVLACVSGTWRIHASTVKGEGEKVSILILNDETALRRVELEYKASRPGYMIFSVDGYDDVFSDMLDSESARLLERINRTIEAMIARGTGFLRRVANGRYIAVVEERQLEQFAQQGYDVLDKIRALEPSINLSISIGIGRRAPTLHEAQEMAVQALDMAQGRGGDQAAEMTPDGFTFYGGVSHGVEKRSKVRSRIVAEALVGLIKAADHVVIMGHRMSDLDAIGSAEGMLRICKICDVPAVIAVKREATLASSLINAIEDAGQEGDFIDPRSALSIISKETLCIVVDTYQVGQVECKEILEKCGKIAVIDHHRKGVGYIENAVLVCHEPYASSASELVTELLQYVGTRDDKPTRIEAEGLLAGIMLDTRNFSLHTGVRTFEAAAALRRYGAETERAWALFDVSLPEYNAKASLVAKAQMYKGCAVVLSGELPAEAQVAVPQAANDLLSIEGVQASFVAVQAGSMVKISARSMGQVNVQVIMESMGGGGHQTMAATVLKHTTMEQAHAHLCAAIDAYRAAQKKGSVKA
ncbi:DHH family phosphoesterase [Faecalibacterium sp. An121]|uniref:DHH family phosphoesterase n=1 Tax=Faecalibacterium sp. An121 TaxID=1965550 RepID=UPI000B375DCD|nr:DHH family phosphoesterase [Faecalibacterium sp. An121]